MIVVQHEFVQAMLVLRPAPVDKLLQHAAVKLIELSTLEGWVEGQRWGPTHMLAPKLDSS